MQKIGVTGGIGAGKSIVCQVFSHLGVPVFNADAQAKAIMHKDPEVKQQLTARYGSDLYDAAGKLNRKKLAGIVFKDEAGRKFVNEVVHPAVGRAFERWAGRQDAPCVIEEAAILIESGTYKKMDAVVLVTAPKELRIKRVMKRDSTTREAVTSRMAKQWDERAKKAMAHYIIANDDKQLVIPQVLTVYQTLCMNATNP